MMQTQGCSVSLSASGRPLASWRQPFSAHPSAVLTRTIAPRHLSRCAHTQSRIAAAAGSPGGSIMQPAPSSPSSDFTETLQSALADEAGFVEMTLRGRPGQAPWRTVSVRPVQLRGKRQLQFSFYDGKQTLVKNFAVGDAPTELSKLLQLSLSSAQLRTTAEELNIQISRKGKPIIHRSTVTGPGTSATGNGDAVVPMQHDRTKQLPISPTEPHAFLQQLGMQMADGRVKADWQDKFTQVNEFLKLLGHTGVLEQWGRPSAPGLHNAARPVSVPDVQASSSSSSDAAQAQAQASGQPLCILDCGCGSSHLTFGTYHYLNNVCGLPARIMGVDTNATLMQRSNDYSRALGLNEQQASFHASPILKFAEQAPVRPDVVLALHACDTATDESLALGIKQQATVIMAVPCCHKHLHRQLSKSSPPAPFGPLLRHGIMKQRQIDLLTDTFRAQLLRIMGYKTDAVEFTSAEHTPRNLLLRSVKLQQPVDSKQDKVVRELLAEYDALKAFWGGVVPHLELLLQDEMQAVRQRVEGS